MRAASKIIFLLSLLVAFMAPTIQAKVNLLVYDSAMVMQPADVEKAAIRATDSVLKAHPLLNNSVYTMREHVHHFTNKTFDFYVVLVLLVSLGVMRFINPRYFQNLLRDLRGSISSSQQIKEHAATSSMFYNLLMNIFFAVSGGMYLYYVFKWYMPQRYAIYSPSLLIVVFIVSLMVLYGAKYLVMRFSGWAFNVNVIVNHYIHNVFLVNRVIAIALLPFIILLAFSQPELALPATILSFFLVGLLFINRYVRSWQVLGSFFQYSKFHFFAYLCASEILPMAVLAKLLIRGMYY